VTYTPFENPLTYGIPMFIVMIAIILLFLRNKLNRIGPTRKQYAIMFFACVLSSGLGLVLDLLQPNQIPFTLLFIIIAINSFGFVSIFGTRKKIEYGAEDEI
jgi:FtsH-binding integral membrane protein